MESVKGSLEGGENLYLRGFGSFVIKKRAEKTGCNILKITHCFTICYKTLWSWRESNPRPNEEATSFLHA
jgi:nucleoid DNA-binding protein